MGKRQKNWNLKKLIKLFKNKNVYITFDVDALDASIMPATGTQNQGVFCGKRFANNKKSLQTSKIIGADIIELAPINKFNSYNFLVAKLVYKILAYIFENKK